MEEEYRLETRAPALADYLRLRAENGLSPFSAAAAERGLAGGWFAVTMVHEGKAVGMGRIIGDGGCFFQIVDIAVDHAHRGRGLGKRIMAALTEQLRAQAPPTAYVTLIADLPADQLYAQYGFKPVAPGAIGMERRV